MTRLLILILALMVMGLSACGGGGGETEINIVTDPQTIDPISESGDVFNDSSEINFFCVRCIGNQNDGVSDETCLAEAGLLLQDCF